MWLRKTYRRRKYARLLRFKIKIIHRYLYYNFQTNYDYNQNLSNSFNRSSTNNSLNIKYSSIKYVDLIYIFAIINKLNIFIVCEYGHYKSHPHPTLAHRSTTLCAPPHRRFTLPHRTILCIIMLPRPNHLAPSVYWCADVSNPTVEFQPHIYSLPFAVVVPPKHTFNHITQLHIQKQWRVNITTVPSPTNKTQHSNAIEKGGFAGFTMPFTKTTTTTTQLDDTSKQARIKHIFALMMVLQRLECSI